jgi:integrase
MLTVTAQLGSDGERVPLKTAAPAARVPMLPVLVAELRAHRSRVAGRSLARVRPDALVFVTSRGKPHGRRNVLRAVYAAEDAVGLNGEGRERVGVHDLRHSSVALALAPGLTLPEAAALARHAKPACDRGRARRTHFREPGAAWVEAGGSVQHVRTRRVTGERPGHVEELPRVAALFVSLAIVRNPLFVAV